MKHATFLFTGVLLASLSGMGRAAPTDYVLHDFTLEQGAVAPTVGHFTYDPLVGFSSFQLTWRDTTFDLTAYANRPFLVLDGVRDSVGTHADSFALLTKTMAAPADDGTWLAHSDCGITECFDSVVGFQSDPNDKVFISFFGTAAVDAPDLPSPISGQWSISAVPETGSLAMLAAGLVTVGASLRITRKRPSL